MEEKAKNDIAGHGQATSSTPEHMGEHPRTKSDSTLDDDDNIASKSSSDSVLDDSSSLSSQDSQLVRTQTNAIIAQDDQTTIRRIATELSIRSGVSGAQGEGSPSCMFPDDETLRPSSNSFDISKWLSVFIRSIRDLGHPEAHPGLVYRDLNVSGSAPDLQVQQTVGTWLRTPFRVGQLLHNTKVPHKHILRNFDGIVQGGELLVVLGRPGSGCSTLLKTMCGENHGLIVDKDSYINYNGVPQKDMVKEFKGEMAYNQEVDKHFPELTVGQTLEFAAAVRTPSHRWNNISRNKTAQYIAQVVMAVCGLSHTYNTKVGNEFIRGVSGGERKRVSIAEMLVAGSPIMAWDNSTRGLDSATALKFVQTLRVAANLAETAQAVAIYQASESIYELFDKASVLFEGRQIYFGPAKAARPFFERQGWECPKRQTTGDFLTSVTNPVERKPRQGYENKVPRTPDEFEAYWRQSPEYRNLQDEIVEYERRYPIDIHGPMAAQLRERKNYAQAKHVRPKSPFIISTTMQIALNTKRAYQRMWNVKTPTVTTGVTCMILALIIGSLVYGNPNATAGFYAKSSVIFMSVLLNALITITEINSLYNQRPIVEKHNTYAFYHPSADAIAGVVADIPIKFTVAVAYNIIIYFLGGLRRKPSQFFIYFLFSFTSTFVMSAIFRSMAAITKTISQAMSLAGVLILGLVMYTGFVIAVPEMHPWFGWIRWINPLFYIFEALVANEFHGREFTCSSIIPAYSPPIGKSWICSAVGSQAGRWTVNGDEYIQKSFRYSYSHVWRNFGIILGFLGAFMLFYFIATEINTVPASVGEMLVYQEGHIPANLRERNAKFVDQSKNGKFGKIFGKHGKRQTLATDEEKGDRDAGVVTDTPGTNTSVHGIPPQRDVFTWRNVVYDIQIKGQDRRLLDRVSGWVKPGTLTALMGVSGAGKTTLLDVLAERTTMGVITGDMLVNGRPRNTNFQRSTGYVQQQDLHLQTATVRESLRFSAMLRQPATVSKAEKYSFVEEVIDMLNMRDFADAVVGVPGEGLNVEQRKLLTIGVELAAKPKLLLFLDEPTSGLDSQSSWAICSFLRKLADSGQAVLCTIHQPSAVLFEQFDRLLFLAKGGKTVYFGPVGKDSRVLLSYFEAKGARRCGSAENPAEYMLEIVNKTTAGDGKEWFTTWNESGEHQAVEDEIEHIHREKSNQESAADQEPGSNTEFAMPFWDQLKCCTHRIFQQYWRMPEYIFAKLMLGMIAGLFIGFSFFHANSSLAGMQDIIFSVFQIVTIFTTLVQQIQPLFVTQRSLYEVRERPGKMYSWKAFMISNIIVEFPYQIFVGVVTWACFMYPIVGIQSAQRQGLILLFMIQLFLYASTFAHMCIAALPDAETAGGVVTLLVMMSLAFCGVLQVPVALPGFWIFMYRVSPFTYWIAGVIATFVHGREVICEDRELSIFDPPMGYTCGQYMEPYLAKAPGQLQNPSATASCRYCQLTVADQYLSTSKVYWHERWRNFGLVWAYIVFNIFMAVLTYYLFRVKKWDQSRLTRKGRASRPKENRDLTATLPAAAAGTGALAANQYATGAETQAGARGGPTETVAGSATGNGTEVNVDDGARTEPGAAYLTGPGTETSTFDAKTGGDWTEAENSAGQIDGPSTGPATGPAAGTRDLVGSGKKTEPGTLAGATLDEAPTTSGNDTGAVVGTGVGAGIVAAAAAVANKIVGNHADTNATNTATSAGTLGGTKTRGQAQDSITSGTMADDSTEEEIMPCTWVDSNTGDAIPPDDTDTWTGAAAQTASEVAQEPKPEQQVMPSLRNEGSSRLQ